MQFLDIAFSLIKFADFSINQRLKMVVIDDTQKVLVCNTSIIWIAFNAESDYLLNTPSMPVKANAGSRDTQEMYKIQNVSYG